MISDVDINEIELFNMGNKKRIPFSFELEITARCNNNCKHCYINLPINDHEAMQNELTLNELKEILNDAITLGALWCKITGGEPLLRKDFPDIYLLLKKKGVMVSVYTNGTLISEEHIKLFKEYPPGIIEITVYGSTKETYEKVTRKPGSFEAFKKGVNLLRNSGIKPRLKAMVLRTNIHEIESISQYCKKFTKDFYRFDPFLHLRYDRDPIRNKDILSERFSPEEIIELEKNDSDRHRILQKTCKTLFHDKLSHYQCNHLFRCGAGRIFYSIGHNGYVRVCPALWHPETIFDLRKFTLKDCWNNLISRIVDIKSDKKEFVDNCRDCSLFDICLWCPANAFLEEGEMDTHIDYFCKLAHARHNAFNK